MPQQPRQKRAEPVVTQKDQGQQRQIAGSAPGRFKHHQQRHRRNAHLKGIHTSPGLGDAGKIRNQVTERTGSQQNQKDIPDRRQLPYTLLFFVCREQQKRKQQQKDTVERPQVNGADRPQRSEIQLEYRPDAEQNHQYFTHGTDIGPHAGVRFLFFQQFLRLFVQLFL